MTVAPDRSLDQAWHLAGFAPECTRKAALVLGHYHRALGHDLQDDEALEFARALEPQASGASLGPSPEALAGWRPDHRYEASGSFHEEQVLGLLEEARRVTLDTLCDLWALSQHLYSADALPALDDDQAAHFPWPVHYRDVLASLDSLEEQEEQVLWSPDLEALLVRLGALWTPGDEGA